MQHAAVVRWLGIGLVFIFFAVAGTPASAQATRTWVSGVGDDANPCSRTAPCKTFAGAISKTAAGGEINVLDPGGFGGVTITKAITISAEGVEAGVLVSGTNGIVVNAPAGAVVVLRGLDIEGLGTGLNGIRFLAGGALHVENCTINNFTARAIDFEPSGASELYVKDSILRNNQASANGAGIFVSPPLGGSARVSVHNVRMENNTVGMRVEGLSQATVRDSVASGNSTHGFIGVSNAAGVPVIDIESSVASNNGASGVRAFQAGTTIRISNMTITGNQNGITANGAGATVVSFGNNRVEGNVSNGGPNATASQV